jgi:hypothetical protein
MWGIGGVLGIAFGILAKGEIDRSHGAQRGSFLATLAIVLGALNVVCCVLALAVGITLLARPSAATAFKAPGRPASPASPALPSSSPKTLGSRGPSTTPGSASRDSGVITTHVGKLVLVDIGTSVRSLGDELDKQRELADRDGKKVLLWLAQPNCPPCNGVAYALADPSMQAALDPVRLVRVDPQDFRMELRQFRIPTDKLPAFVVIGSDNHGIDYVHGGEWGEDVARNIAPVLGKFVRGAYKQRRDPWRGGQRDDETPL